MSRIRAYNSNLNGRFLHNAKSTCGCKKTESYIPTITNPITYTDRVTTTNTGLYTNRVQPINGIIETLLGDKSGEIVTVGIKIDTPTIVKLGAVVLGAGLLIKNLKLKF